MKIIALALLTFFITNARASEMPVQYTPDLDFTSEVRLAREAFLKRLPSEDLISVDNDSPVGPPSVFFSGVFYTTALSDDSSESSPVSGRSYVLLQPVRAKYGDVTSIARFVRVDDKQNTTVENSGVAFKKTSDEIECPVLAGPGSADEVSKIIRWTYENLLLNVAESKTYGTENIARSVQKWNARKIRWSEPMSVLIGQEGTGKPREKTTYLAELRAVSSNETDSKEKDRPVIVLHFLVTFQAGKAPIVQIVELWQSGNYG